MVTFYKPKYRPLPSTSAVAPKAHCCNYFSGSQNIVLLGEMVKKSESGYWKGLEKSQDNEERLYQRQKDFRKSPKSVQNSGGLVGMSTLILLPCEL